MKANFNPILPYFSLHIPLRSLYCIFNCSDMLLWSTMIQITHWIVYQHTLLSYQLKTSHWNFSRAATLHLCNMADRGEKLQQPHCYHPFSDSRDTYLTKNHYENYSPKMVPTNPTGSWTTCIWAPMTFEAGVTSVCSYRPEGWDKYKTVSHAMNNCEWMFPDDTIY